jgi:hypothetical protein
LLSARWRNRLIHSKPRRLALDGAASLNHHAGVVVDFDEDLWPKWSNWALLAVVLTSIATIIASLNDIF